MGCMNNHLVRGEIGNMNTNKQIEMFVVKTNYKTPDSFGELDISRLENVKFFSLILDNPFIRLDKWVNPRVMQGRCKLVISPNILPGTCDKSPIAEFCYKYRIPFVHCELRSEVVNRYVNMYGCTFVNLAEEGKYPRLLLVGIPKGRRIVNIPEHREIIGLCTDTINLDDVEELRVPGNLYGMHKKEFASRCKLGRFITYPKQETRRSFSTMFGSWLEEEEEMQYEEA